MTNGQGNYTQVYKKCTHDGPSCFYTTDESDAQVHFVAVNSAGMKTAAYGADVVFDLAGTAPDMKNSGWVSAPEPWSKLSRHLTPPPVVRLNWTDASAPPSTVGVQFWLELYEMIPKPGVVVVGCIGGHGRTGTFLASILVAVQGYDPQKAIAFVRKNHCESAIETKAQENYLNRLYQQRRELLGGGDEQ